LFRRNAIEEKLYPFCRRFTAEKEEKPQHDKEQDTHGASSSQGAHPANSLATGGVEN